MASAEWRRSFVNSMLIAPATALVGDDAWHKGGVGTVEAEIAVQWRNLRHSSGTLDGSDRHHRRRSVRSLQQGSVS